MPSQSTRILVPAGALGLGWNAGALAVGVAAGPDLIAIDGGSTDSGPSYLGRGVSKYSDTRIRADWGELVRARAEAGCPLIIGTAGTCGVDAMVDHLADMTADILAEAGLSARVTRLHCNRLQEEVAARFDDLRPLPGAPPLALDDVTCCSNIVALAGVEQVQAALATGADIVICGRTTDTAILAALPIRRGTDPGVAWHGAKIGECGSLCCTHPWAGPILLDFEADAFTVTPCLPEARATPDSVAAHMLYENADPWVLSEPGGHLDVTGARYDAQDDRRVRVTGGRWVPGPYAVKLEGARAMGWGAASLVLIRDPDTIAELDAWCDTLLAAAREGTGPGVDMAIARIGHDAVLGAAEPSTTAPHEVGILLKVRAGTQDAALEAARAVNPLLLHHSVDPSVPMPTFSFPLSPPEMATGPSFEFVMHHVLPLDDPMDGFRLEVADV
ncbi:acyclic terpene utilization AtuA family protein [Jannaschia sp. LMIT008]|uniref:acyclic terpene utilization AtuA family protein n=1 Tax=Jannaschia maritima TaxID=3032585 RepID=UPI0028126F39|nr:acyclic terpene utilization AtuA family protein [Jannaschia sp. LMIT008]